MNTSLLEKQFARMGARFRVGAHDQRGRLPTAGFAVDIARDGDGPYFQVTLAKEAARDVEVVDLKPQQRHLLLLIREPAARGERKHKFLCGHDERDWFAAAVPDLGGVATVRTAMEALKPTEVVAAQVRKRVKARHRNRRHNKAFIRQGEWFFVPAPDLLVDPKLVLTHEPLQRGRGKPHDAEFLYRVGGETVYVTREYPQGLTEAEYKVVLTRKPSAKRWRWTTMRRNPGVFVQGRIRHPDHKTVKLNGWHRVSMNTETQAPAMRHLAFLD